MIIDLVKRVIWLKQKGDKNPWNRFVKYLRRLDNIEGSFTSNGINYSWQFFDSDPFLDIISEYNKDYIYIKDQEAKIQVIGKVDFHGRNLIGFNREVSIWYLWIISEFFPGLEEVPKRPIQIRPPFVFDFDRRELNLKLGDLFDSLHNPAIEIVEFVEYKENHNEMEVWRASGNHKSDDDRQY